MSEIDHILTKDIICPYCGYKIDVTDYICDNTMRGKEICNKCGNEFEFYSDVEIVWVTSKVK